MTDWRNMNPVTIAMTDCSLDIAKDLIEALRQLDELRQENAALKRELREKCGPSFWTDGRLHPLTENQ